MTKNNSAQNRDKQLQSFAEFAKRKFINHSEELETIYQNEKVQPDDLWQAYQNHQQLLAMELHDKIDELLTIENAYLGPLFNVIKDDYIEKLRDKGLATQVLSGSR
jgi:hypothetical protein